MKTAYQYDEQGIYYGSVEFDPDDSIPPRSTSQKPPETAGAEVAQWAGGMWVVLDSAPPAPSPDWPALIAARRWLAETAGTTFGGMPIDTDDRSKLLINGAVVEAMLDSTYTLNWKTSVGAMPLTAAQVISIGRAVRAHVQICFDREDALLGAVADGSITADLLEEGWPA